MIRLFALLWLFAGAAHAALPGELLEPEKAFRFSTRALDANAVEVRFAIADGYYMYRERFRFAADPGSGYKLGAPQFPPGQKKKDEFFGEVETYRGEVAIRIPVEGKGGALGLTVTSQGCADV
ncbi:MAG: protein-disulfide reductase DsbD N-terminal domain-containing protein, partial [Burkholderiales bacterium]